MPASTQPLRHHPPAAYLRFVCVLAAIIAVFALNSLGPDSVNFESNFYIAKCSPILIECLSGLCAAKPVRPGIGPVAPGRSASRSCDVGRRDVGGSLSTSPPQVDSAAPKAVEQGPDEEAKPQRPGRSR